MDILQPGAKITVRRDGLRVLILLDGRLLLEMPWQQADVLASALKAQARRAEELAEVDTLIEQQALVIRKGVPFGLTDRPDINAEAKKEAAWGQTPRKYIPQSNYRGVFTPDGVWHEGKNPRRKGKP